MVPINLKEANLFVENFHRHNKKVQGAKFCLGASYNDKLVGVIIVGRPVARKLDDGFTAEVTRSCVLENGNQLQDNLNLDGKRQQTRTRIRRGSKRDGHDQKSY